MSRRLALLIPLVMLLTLSGCIIVPGHGGHCCWRYGAYGHPYAR
ncbi:MAG: hypothetical protein P4L87_10995 [Formivibrio sp.]|nr:hypothetical protein [Formivibrio sp.]